MSRCTVPLSLFVLVVCLSLPSAAQEAAAMQGERGTVIVKQIAPGEVGIRYLPAGTTRTDHPGSLYFIVQHEDSVPPAKPWSGQARLFYADKVVAVLGAEGTRIMYKLTNEPMPQSLVQFQFKPLDAFGIALYKRVPTAALQHP